MKEGHKTFKFVDGEIGEGTLKAAFAQLNVVDHDGDVLTNGELQPGPVVISEYNHASNHFNALPVGKGRVYEDGDWAIVDAKFFMGIERAQEHFATIKEVGELQEYSYGFMADFERGTFDYPDGSKRDVHYMRNVKVHEVSPVLRGAGIDTHTVSAKSLAGLTTDEALARLSELAVDLKGRGMDPADITGAITKGFEEDNENPTQPDGSGVLYLLEAATEYGWDLHGKETA